MRVILTWRFPGRGLSVGRRARHGALTPEQASELDGARASCCASLPSLADTPDHCEAATTRAHDAPRAPGDRGRRHAAMPLPASMPSSRASRVLPQPPARWSAVLRPSPSSRRRCSTPWSLAFFSTRRGSSSRSGIASPIAVSTRVVTICWPLRRVSPASSPSPKAMSHRSHWFHLGRASRPSAGGPRWFPGPGRCSSTLCRRW